MSTVSKELKPEAAPAKAEERTHNWRKLEHSGFTFRRCQKCHRIEGWGFDNQWSVVSEGKPVVGSVRGKPVKSKKHEKES